jgi:hypothetical protein
VSLPVTSVITPFHLSLSLLLSVSLSLPLSLSLSLTHTHTHTHRQTGGKGVQRLPIYKQDLRRDHGGVALSFEPIFYSQVGRGSELKTKLWFYMLQKICNLFIVVVQKIEKRK